MRLADHAQDLARRCLPVECLSNLRLGLGESVLQARV
jgi:hypothetical protein